MTMFYSSFFDEHTMSATMSLDQEPHTFAGWIAAAAASVAGLALAARKWLVAWKSEGVNLAQNDAQTTLIQQLHAELQRLATQNALLAEEVNKLQRTIIVLNTQVGELTVEKQSLHDQLAELTQEIARIKS